MVYNNSLLKYKQKKLKKINKGIHFLQINLNILAELG